MKLVVKNRAQIERENEVKTPHFIVSISNPGSERPKVAFNEWTMGVSYLWFEDSDTSGVLFSADMARGIKEQILLLQDEWKIDTVVCQCEAGQSRSAGMAAAIASFFNGNDDEFFGGPGMYGARRFTPNMHVYRTMLSVLHEEPRGE